MKQYKNKAFYYCPFCKNAQEYISNPLYWHYCSDCGKDYAQSRLIGRTLKVRIV